MNFSLFYWHIPMAAAVSTVVWNVKSETLLFQHLPFTDEGSCWDEDVIQFAAVHRVIS